MSTCSNATAIVLLPEPDNPVNQSVAPACLSSFFRSSRVTVPSCQVICAAFTSLIGENSVSGGWSITEPLFYLRGGTMPPTGWKECGVIGDLLAARPDRQHARARALRTI